MNIVEMENFANMQILLNGFILPLLQCLASLHQVQNRQVYLKLRKGGNFEHVLAYRLWDPTLC